MDIVPLDDTLLVEGRIRPQDIAFIRPNQDAVVKISAYDSSVYGSLKGKVERISADTIVGSQDVFDRFAGQVVLVVNTASECGLTPQYDGMQKLQDEYKDRGFTVLGFPCNQFGAQEPGDAKQIATFCETNYAVTFPMFAKIDVNGSGAHPLYEHLKREKSGLLGPAIKWNFTKFLVDRAGKVVARHAPTARPEGLKKEIEALL